MKYAGVVVLMQPDKKINDNIKTYLDYLDVLYVVDNTPNKQQEEFLIKDKKIKYIPNNKNIGIASALNIGAEHAIKENYEWLLTMDQDSSFQKDNLKKMEEFLEELKKNSKICELLGYEYEKIGIIAPFYKLNNTFNSHIGLESPLMVMTSGNLINLKAYQAIKGFKEWLFIDCVDFEYCLNLKKNGYEIIQMNNITLNHHLGETKEYHFLWKKITSSNHSAIRKYYLIRNRHYINDMYKKEFAEYCQLELKQTKKETIKILLFEKEKIKKIKYMIKGYNDYKKGKTGEINEKN